jgi:hypothetical protein
VLVLTAASGAVLVLAAALLVLALLVLRAGYL